MCRDGVCGIGLPKAPLGVESSASLSIETSLSPVVSGYSPIGTQSAALLRLAREFALFLADLLCTGALSELFASELWAFGFSTLVLGAAFTLPEESRSWLKMQFSPYSQVPDFCHW